MTAAAAMKMRKKLKRKKGNELVEYLKDRDEKFLKVFQNMHVTTNKYMEKLIVRIVKIEKKFFLDTFLWV